MATPLGMGPGKRQRGDHPLWNGKLSAVLITASLATLLFASWRLVDHRGVSGAVAIIERIEKPAAGETRALVPIEREPANIAPRERSDMATVEAESGVKVIRQNGQGANGQGANGNGANGAGGGLVIKVPDAAGGGPLIADARISERAQVGILPRIGEGNLMARNVYAVPFNATAKPKIAIVITGMGIGARGTSDAIAKLPGEVTLAFAPYGRDLANQVARARRDGHEILLQVPMEPRDYPESDPGPHTLRSSADSRANIERLHWLMSRFAGYVGLMNFMGDKLMTAEKSYSDLLAEINRRGLVFLDDGSNRASSTMRLAGKIGLPARVADIIHEPGGGKALEAELQEIEKLARARGSAVLSVPALPGNIEKIAMWLRDLNARGLVLAPLSAIIGK